MKFRILGKNNSYKVQYKKWFSFWKNLETPEDFSNKLSGGIKLFNSIDQAREEIESIIKNENLGSWTVVSIVKTK